MRSIKLEFDILEEVSVPKLELKGIITGIFISTLGIEYRVRYFHNGDSKEVYFFPKEVLALK